MKIAIIPARGGSKRILKKNIKPFLGKPIIAYSIETAIKSQCFDKVIVSTDDEDIVKIAQNYGAEVPFIRPSDIADDFTGTNDVVAHAINELGYNISYACCIYATAPFASMDSIKEGMRLIVNNDNIDFAVTVTPSPFPLNRALAITKKNEVEQLKMIQPEHLATRTQDLAETYFDAGQIYWGKAKAFVNRHDMFLEKTAPIVIPNYLTQDIDTEDDWQEAEIKYLLLKEKKIID